MHPDPRFSAGLVFIATGAAAELLNLPAGWLILVSGAILVVLS